MNVLTDERIEVFFDWLVSRLFKGAFDWLEDVYVYPVSVFSAGDIHVERTPEDTVAYLTMRREELAELGVYAMSVDVIQVRKKAQSNRFSARVEYAMHSRDGSEFGRSKVHYKCNYDTDGAIRIESLEILDTALPYAAGMKSARRN